MAYQITPDILISAVILAFTAALAVYGALEYHRRGHQSELLAFVSLMVVISLWQLTKIFVGAVTSAELKLLGFNLINTVVVWLLLYSLLWFALAYTDNGGWINRWTVAFAAATVLSIGTAGIIFPEFLYDANGLTTQGPVTILGITFERWVVLQRELKPPFRLLQLFGYAIILLSCGILGRYLVRNRGDVYTRQAVALAVGIGTPAVVNFLLFVGLLPPERSATDLAFIVTAIAFAIAIFRYRLLGVAPVGRQQLVDQLGDPVVMIDTEGRVVDSNPAARELVDAPAGWRGMAGESFFAPFPEQLDRFAGKKSVATEITLEAGGETQHFYLDISPIEDEGGTVRGQLIVLRDITPQKHRQQELEATKRELEQSNEQLDQFAGVVSHDLRNPLSVISGRVKLMEDDVGEREHLEAISKSVVRMENIITDLLTLSRVGRNIDEPDTVSLASVATDSWDKVRPDGTELDLRVPERATVEADRDRLMNVFENLFRNAREHNEPPLTVRVGVLDSAADDGDTPTGFYVEDDGDGIPADERDDIFDHGYTTNTNGTGFGLSIVEEIVDAHDWAISVCDAEDGGARFEVTGVEISS